MDFRASYWDCFKGVNLRRTELATAAWLGQELTGFALPSGAYFVRLTTSIPRTLVMFTLTTLCLTVRASGLVDQRFFRPQRGAVCHGGCCHRRLPFPFASRGSSKALDLWRHLHHVLSLDGWFFGSGTHADSGNCLVRPRRYMCDLQTTVTNEILHSSGHKVS